MYFLSFHFGRRAMSLGASLRVAGIGSPASTRISTCGGVGLVTLGIDVSLVPLLCWAGKLGHKTDQVLNGDEREGRDQRALLLWLPGWLNVGFHLLRGQTAPASGRKRPRVRPRSPR